MKYSLLILSLGAAFNDSVSAAYQQLAPLSAILSTSGAQSFNAFAIQGTELYATVTGPANNYAITKVTGLGGGPMSTAVLTSQAAIDAVNGAATALSGATGFGFRATNSLQFADTNSGNIFRVNAVTVDITTQVSKSTIDSHFAITNSQILSAHGNVPNGEYAFYQARSGSRALAITTTSGTVTTLLNSAALNALNGSDQLFGGIAGSGSSIYFALGNTVGSRNLYSYDLSTNLATLVLTESAIASLNSNSSGFSLTDIFAAPNGLVYLRNTQSRDLLSFDPANPASTLKVELTRAQLEAGPANTSLITQLGWFNGKLAFAVTSSGGGAIPGVYAIPESSSLAFVALWLLGFRRQRQ